jgi:hypothetical protein
MAAAPTLPPCEEPSVYTLICSIALVSARFDASGVFLEKHFVLQPILYAVSTSTILFSLL